MTNIKTFKVSQLPAIKSIDSNDLLMVSDYDKGSIMTKKMTMGQMTEYMSTKLVDNPTISALIDAKVNQILDSILDNSHALSVAVLNIISSNNDFVFDVLDGSRNNQIVIGDNEGA